MMDKIFLPKFCFEREGWCTQEERGSDKKALNEKIFKTAHDKYNNSTPNPLPNILAPYNLFKWMENQNKLNVISNFF